MPRPALSPADRAPGDFTADASRPDPSHLANALRPLARKGALLRVAAGAFDVFSPRNGHAGPVASLDRQDFETALTKRWLARLPELPADMAHDMAPDTTYALTRAGLAAVRARLSAGPPAKADGGGGRIAPHADNHPARAPVARAPAPNAATNPDESPLAWLRRRKDKEGRPLISAAEFEAGERLRAEFWLAQMTPRVTASWNPAAAGRNDRRSTPGHGVELRDNVVAARQRVHKALAGVGPDFAGILIDVCCHLQGIEDAERQSGLPQRSGKVVLQLALRSLARHYGMIAPDGGAWTARAGIRHWGTPDYKPNIEGWR